MTKSMKKSRRLRSLFLLAAAGFIFANSGCTSKKAEDQQVIENADAEKIEAESADISGDAEATDLSLEADLGETTSTVSTETPPPATEEAPTAITLDDSSLDAEAKGTSTTDATALAPVPEEMAPAITADAETTSAPVEIAPMPEDALATKDEPISEFPSETVQPTPVDALAMAAVDPGATSEVVTKPSGGSLKKVATTPPYQGKDGGWINTVYVARPKESLSDISTKIYGVDKSKELKKIAENNYLKSRAAKAGDKIYYVSPNRPDDSTKTMLYYEDMGMVPETYVAKKGDNLRKISKELLGYDGAWKEIWTSNSVESKAALKDGETLRYWKVDNSAFASTGSAQEGSSAKLIDASQAQAAMPESAQLPAPASMETPTPPVDAAAELPPPPDAAMAAAGMELPPPPTELAPPPPPPPPPDEMAEAPIKKKINLDEAAAEETTEGLDSDTMMSMGALGVLVALLAIVIIRKRKQKANAMEMVDGQMNI